MDKSTMTIVAALAAGAAAATMRTPYANDFTTRTSGATPSGRWMETSYIPGALARPVSTVSAEGQEPYNSTTAYQDGWTMKEGLANADIFYMVADDGGNQGVLVTNETTSASSATVAMQPLYNEFTDGVLKISIDIRTPGSDAFSAPMHCYLLPIYKAGLDIAASSLTGQYPMRMGAVWQSDGSQYNLRATMHAKSNDGDGNTYYGRLDTRNTIESGHWIRYEAILDLSAGKATATFADLGTTHPTPETAVGSPVDFRRWEGDSAPTTFTFITPITAETGGVAGLALYARNFKKSDAADAPMFDNVVVSWKAPGADDFAPVYENDFSTRRYRQIEPAGTTSGAYALVPTTNTVQSGFYRRIFVDSVPSASENTYTPRLVPDFQSGGPYVGSDGWRRIDGKLNFTLVNPNKTSAGYGWDNATVLRATSSDNSGSDDTARGAIAVPLGTSLTAGKVRLYFDIFAPAKWYAPSGQQQNYCGVYLGSAAEAAPTASTTINTLLDGKGAFGGGIFTDTGSKGGNSQTYKWIFTATSQFMGGQKRDFPGNPTYCNWYRFQATADLVSKTYDIEAYLIGPTGLVMSATSMFTEDKVRFRKSDGVFHGNAPAAIDTVFIALQSAAKYSTSGTRYDHTYGCYPLFDNIRVCHVNDDGTDGAEIYSCNFEYGYRTSVRDAAALATATDREGADLWIRRDIANGFMNIIDAGGGDGVVSMTGVGVTDNDPKNRTMFAVQPFGSASKNCASVDLAADIRPPACFSAEDLNYTVSSGYAYVEVGGDNYYQGVYRPASGNNWRSEPRIGFGFTANSKDACSQFTNIVFSVQTRTSLETSTVNSSAAIDTSHWYRFRVKASPTNAGGKFTVKVYDQGATKPAASDADGTLVETFSDLALPAFDGEGMTTLGLAACNFTGTRGGGLDDPNVALVDNLSATFNPSAFLIMLK